MEMRGQDKEIEIPTTIGYNLPNRDSPSSSSKLSSPTVGERSSDDQQHQPPHQIHTSIFNEPPHHNLYPPPRQPHHRPTSDPDLSTPIAPTSNPPRTAPPQTTTTTTTSTPSIRYRECLRNHAASMGSHVVDGCGEFMASGEEGTPESLRCAACECHRNFHRKEVEGEQPQPPPLPPQPQHVPNYHSYYPNKHNGHLHFPPPSSSLHHHRLVATTATPSLVPPVMMAFGGPAESSSEDLNMFQSNTGAQLSVQAPLSSKKRFRTKFSQHQKDRMMEFADNIGWKIQKHNEQEVQNFCSQVGVKRQVFKVWMHNNKQTSKKQQIHFHPGARN
ncbi:Zinc-finger homeodomain protein 6 [Spatholobus suberectus]|nr:Zinc-finger homeodomain protein 6 [Spatholobus suberectus]